MRNGTTKRDPSKYACILSSIGLRRRNTRGTSPTGMKNSVYLLMYDSNEEKLSFYTLNFTTDDGRFLRRNISNEERIVGLFLSNLLWKLIPTNSTLAHLSLRCIHNLAHAFIFFLEHLGSLKDFHLSSNISWNKLSYLWSLGVCQQLSPHSLLPLVILTLKLSIIFVNSKILFLRVFGF